MRTLHRCRCGHGFLASNKRVRRCRSCAYMRKVESLAKNAIESHREYLEARIRTRNLIPVVMTARERLDAKRRLSALYTEVEKSGRSDRFATMVAIRSLMGKLSNNK